MIVLIVLVAMTLAGLALMRSSNMATLVTGNLALRQGGTHEGNVGVENAITWLQNNSSGMSLYNDIPEAGYSASQDEPDATTDESWDHFWGQKMAANAQSYTDPDTQNTVSYFIHRLCKKAGAPTASGVNCATSLTTGAATGNSKAHSGLEDIKHYYYRVTVRIDGPHNSVNYVQTTVAM